MNREQTKQTLIDHGVSDIPGALLDALADTTTDGVREALPKTIGRLELGERLSQDHYCGGSHDMPNGQPIYWQQRGGEYPDDIDGFCLSCAIDQAESDAGWCECSIQAALTQAPRSCCAEERAFQIGDRVTKTKGSSWTGRIVGTYSTSLTPEGYAIESENEPGSVQIYPATAIRSADHAG